MKEENIKYSKDFYGELIFEFLKIVNKFPEKIAIQDEIRKISYQELDQESDHIAKNLKNKGFFNGDRIGICLNRSIDAIIFMIAILKINCTYVLLSIDFPLSKIDRIYKQFCLKAIIYNKYENSKLDGMPFVISTDEAKTYSNIQKIILEQTYNVHPMYYILTSGTSGSPKCVSVWQSSVVNLVKNNTYVSIDENDVFLNLSSLIFDGSIFEIWGALLNGAKLVILTPGYPKLSNIADKINQQKISILFMTTKIFNSMVNNRLEDLLRVKKILFGGEQASEAHVKIFLEKMNDFNYLCNIYGPTETTTFSFFFPIKKDYDFNLYPNIPIGKPISGAEYAVATIDKGFLKENNMGELLIGGKGLGRYANDVEKNQVKFIKNSFPHILSEFLFLTNDFVEVLNDGNLMFLYRNDRVLKIRGFRVNLEEIENTICDFNNVENAAVIHHREGDIDLIVLVVCKNNKFDIEEFNHSIIENFPDYMRPNRIYFDDIPLTSSGKTDFELLKNKFLIVNTEGLMKFPERRELKKIIRSHWQSQIPNIVFSDDEDFLDIGGNSLMLINILDKLQRDQAIGKYLNDLTILEVFDYSTIDNLANYLIQKYGNI